MAALLVSHRCHAERSADLAARAQEAALELVVLPDAQDARLDDSDCARVRAAFFSEDVFPDFSRQFFSALRKAPQLEWLHVFNAGIDHPIYAEMLARGVRLTTSSGTAALPIAQTAIAGLLLLARGFPHWIAAQRERRWAPHSRATPPRDLVGQTALVVGIGHIGSEFARLARALGLHVIGVRRTHRETAVVDEQIAPASLGESVARADWLVIACPLTPETRRLIDAAMLSKMPRGARVIMNARCEIIVEEALIEALRGGHLAGAYLDVFEREPLASDSPLWDMPNVIVTPHNSAASSGNAQRVYDLFTANLARWAKGEPLVNEMASK